MLCPTFTDQSGSAALQTCKHLYVIAKLNVTPWYSHCKQIRPW